MRGLRADPVLSTAAPAAAGCLASAALLRKNAAAVAPLRRGLLLAAAMSLAAVERRNALRSRDTRGDGAAGRDAAGWGLVGEPATADAAALPG